MATTINLTDAQYTTGQTKEWAYNCIDCIATLEIDDVLDDKMSASDKRTHDFYMAMQAPALDMTIRGMLIDQTERETLNGILKKELSVIERELAGHPSIRPVWDKMEKNSGACLRPSRKDGKHKWQPGVEDTVERKCLDCGAARLKVRPFKASSDDDLKHLLYDIFKMKKQLNKDHNVTVDKEAREKLTEKYPKHSEVLTLLSRYADIEKQIGFFKFRSPDGRFHSSFNVGVTSTHRWSSNQDADGNGGNGQNITEKHRYVFTADPGMELCYADLKQAESKVISFVAGDEAYIEAHEGGDTHTFVCRLVWPEGVGGKEWTGDLDQDKKIATSANPKWDDKPGHDFRFQSKAVQHGSNLGLTPFGMAIQKRIPIAAASEGQSRYFKAFPGIRGYQRYIDALVKDQHPIITPLGVRFKLFGRPWDEHTYKEGLAVIPQSMVGHIISIGLMRIYDALPDIQLLAQVHDAILFQFPKGRYDLVYEALELMKVPVVIKAVDGTVRTMVIGTEAAVGNNWGHKNTNPDRGRLNPDGISEIEFHSKTEWKIK